MTGKLSIKIFYSVPNTTTAVSSTLDSNLSIPLQEIWHLNSIFGSFHASKLYIGYKGGCSEGMQINSTLWSSLLYTSTAQHIGTLAF